MHKQPYVVRFYYSTEEDATSAHEQLENMGFFGDTVKSAGSSEHSKWKVVFAEHSLTSIRVALKRLTNKPKAAEAFDPQRPYEEGFRALS